MTLCGYYVCLVVLCLSVVILCLFVVGLHLFVTVLHLLVICVRSLCGHFVSLWLFWVSLWSFCISLWSLWSCFSWLHQLLYSFCLHPKWKHFCVLVSGSSELFSPLFVIVVLVKVLPGSGAQADIYTDNSNPAYHTVHLRSGTFYQASGVGTTYTMSTIDIFPRNTLHVENVKSSFHFLKVPLSNLNKEKLHQCHHQVRLGNSS